MDLSIVGQINDKSFKKFSKDLNRRSGKDVTIELYSEGGDESAGLAFYGKILRHSGLVTVVVHGQCNSAALAVLAAGDFRYCTPEATFLVHDSTITITGTILALQKALNEQLAAEMKWDNILSKASNLSPEQWRKISEVETILTAEDALKFGLITKILRGTK